MDEIGVKNILSRYSDIEDREIIEFLFSAAILYHLTDSWPSLNCMCKTKHKAIGNG